jgi:hypothetical protein
MPIFTIEDTNPETSPHDFLDAPKTPEPAPEPIRILPRHELTRHPIVTDLYLHNDVPYAYEFDPEQPLTTVLIDAQGIIWAGETIVAHISTQGHIRHAMEMPLDTTPEVVQQITRSLISNGTYLHNNLPTTISIQPDGSHKLNHIPHASAFDTHLSACMAFVKVKVTKDSVNYLVCQLDGRNATALFCSSLMRESLSQIEVVNEVSLPFFPPGSDTPQFNPIGYNPINRTYTTGVAIASLPPLTPELPDVKAWHWDLVKGFKWEDPTTDYPTYVAQTLAGYTLDMITPVLPGGIRGSRPTVPFSLIQSSSPEGSSGKSLLQFLSSVAPYGIVTEWNIDKKDLKATITTELNEGKRVLFIDEAKYSMGDELLTLATGKGKGRVLGVSESVSGDLHVLLCAVSPKFSAMMARRVLTCSVNTWPDYLTRQHKFLSTASISLMRPQMLAFCQHLVQTWITAGCPKAKPNSQWPEYSSIIGGILEANGYRNTLHEKIAAANMTNEDNDHIDAQWPAYFKLVADGTLSFGDATSDGHGTVATVGVHQAKDLLTYAQSADFYPSIDPQRPTASRTFMSSLSQWLDKDSDLCGYKFKKVRKNSGTCIEIVKISD